MCTNLYGSQKEGGNFFNLLQKEGGTQKRVPSEKGGGGPALEETMLNHFLEEFFLRNFLEIIS